MAKSSSTTPFKTPCALGFAEDRHPHPPGTGIAGVREHFGSHFGRRPRQNLAFAFQKNLDDLPAGFSVPAGREKPWGTGHAIWAARNEIDAPFAVINADDFYGARSYGVMRDFLAKSRPGEFALAGFKLSKTLSDYGSVSRGICRSDSAGFPLMRCKTHQIGLTAITFSAVR